MPSLSFFRTNNGSGASSSEISLCSMMHEALKRPLRQNNGGGEREGKENKEEEEVKGPCRRAKRGRGRWEAEKISDFNF